MIGGLNMLEVGNKFKLTDDAVEHYGQEYKDKEFTVCHVATSIEEHQGYDEGLQGMALYDAVELNFSVYEYEIEEV
jgi:hypothetical protein